MELAGEVPIPIVFVFYHSQLTTWNIVKWIIHIQRKSPNINIATIKINKISHCSNLPSPLVFPVGILVSLHLKNLC